ncbi:caspase-8-like [Aplochiton taeniatus]
MSALNAIRGNKTTLQAILTVDYSLILNKVYEHKLVTDREYRKLKDIPRLDVEGHVIELVDKLMSKGEDICKGFLHLLQNDCEIQQTFPTLTGIQKYGAKEWSNSNFTELNVPPQHGDAFICCILSHGDKGSVYGTCGGLLPIEKITSTFNGGNCPTLIDKPKLFFIQACQGLTRQHGVVADGGASEADAYPPYMVFTPEKADTLVAIATVQNYAAFRDPAEGSWFIQSLCSQLEVGCRRGDDIVTILTRVNDKVSQMQPPVNPALNKQIPEVRYTLRRKLVLSFY